MWRWWVTQWGNPSLFGFKLPYRVWRCISVTLEPPLENGGILYCRWWDLNLNLLHPWVLSEDFKLSLIGFEPTSPVCLKQSQKTCFCSESANYTVTHPIGFKHVASRFWEGYTHNFFVSENYYKNLYSYFVNSVCDLYLVSSSFLQLGTKTLTSSQFFCFSFFVVNL